MSAPNQLRVPSGAATDMRHELDQCSCDVALEGPLGSAYNEEAFRYFLDIERKRSELSSRPLLLLLVDFATRPGMNGDLENSLSARVFSGLSRCLRETDFFGWYREGQAIGAVLTQRTDSPDVDGAAQVTERVSGVLRKCLPAVAASQLQVRVYQLPSSVSL
jgi:hypothetical protein